MGTHVNITGIRSRPRSGLSRPPLHKNSRTSMYLYCLNSGARVVDPGDLDPSTEEAFEALTAAGILICKRNHGRRIWRKAQAWEAKS